LITDW